MTQTSVEHFCTAINGKLTIDCTVVHFISAAMLCIITGQAYNKRKYCVKDGKLTGRTGRAIVRRACIGNYTAREL